MSKPMRLPRGFAALRTNLGAILRAQRQQKEIALKILAADVGIARESLSKIECGRRVPSYDTLSKIMGLLDLGWEDVAVEGSSDRPPRQTIRGDRGEYLAELGENLRGARMARGLTLSDLARISGLSYSQLSRIERGQVGHSAALEEDPDYAACEFDDRRSRFRNPELAKLVGRE